ncbi:MAG: DUF805 domain-containing protein [Akkermansia sp.]|nr:DUF805 domain-containing protein [Akkermansia sp.]
MNYYYLTPDKKPNGPMPLEELCAKAEGGQLSVSVLVAKEGDASWRPLAAVAAEQGMALNVAGGAGACPTCGQELSILPDGSLPLSCPHCGRAFRPIEGKENNLWYNFTLALRQYAKFTGRATRMEYWSFILFSNIVCFLANVLFHVMETMNSEWGIAEGIVSLVLMLLIFVLIIPSYAVMTRRLHDAGWSGKWVLAMLLCMLAVMGGLAGMLCSLDYEAVEFEEAFSQAAISWAIVAGVAYVAMALIGLLSFVVSLFDSQRGANQYGPSRKYPMG